MNKSEILKLIKSSGLTADVKQYCSNIISGGLRSSLKTALRKNAGEVIRELDGILTDGSVILACSKEDVLFATGFNKNNKSPARFESALAEIRAAIFLAAEGFTDLNLIGTSAKKTADLRGTRKGKDYVFEVCCIQTTKDLTSVAYLADSSGALRKFGKKPVDYLELKYNKKARQLKSSRKEYGCACGGVIFAVDPYSLSAFADKSGLNELARGLHERKNKPLNTHICILSGGDGCVFPAW
ncbi:MAG: hypothetical protein WCK75_10280 [Elusimicrobiota bacterium]